MVLELMTQNSVYEATIKQRQDGKNFEKTNDSIKTRDEHGVLKKILQDRDKEEVNNEDGVVIKSWPDKN